jgi:hypothetical protein
VPVELGDPSPRGRRQVGTREEIALRFGPGFDAAVDAATRGRWQGPIASVHGFHVVFVDEPLAAHAPALAEVRGQVRQALLEERRARHLRARLDALRAGYAVVVERSR